MWALSLLWRGCASRTLRGHTRGVRGCWPRASDRSRVKQRIHPLTSRFTLTIDTVAAKGALDELVQMTLLAYDVPATNCRGNALRTVQFTSPDNLLQALGIAAPLRDWCLSRRSARKDR